MKKILAVVCLLFLAHSASAAEFLAPSTDRDGGNLNLGTQESHKNLYVAGNNLTINSATKGDLSAAGGMVTIDGNVEKSLMVAGGNLFINGAVGENAKIAGGNVSISSSVAGDLLVGSGNLTISDKASIGGDLIIAGGNVTINAPVKGNLKIAGGTVTINSKISGNINAQISRQLIFGDKAEVVGKIYYKSPEAASISSSAKLGAIAYTPWQKNTRSIKAFLTAAFAIKLLAWILAACLLSYLWLKRTKQVTGLALQKPWESLGLGLISFLVWPLGAVVIFLTFVGYYVGVVLAIGYVLFLLFSTLFATIIIGQFVIKYLTKPNEQAPAWQPAVIGVLIWEVLKFIPVIGWLVCGIVFLMAFGALVKAAKMSWAENN